MNKKNVISLITAFMLTVPALAQFNPDNDQPPELSEYTRSHSTGDFLSGIGALNQFSIPFLGDDDSLYLRSIYRDLNGNAIVYQKIDPNNVYMNLSPIDYSPINSNPCSPFIPANQCYYENDIFSIATSPSGEYSYYVYIRRQVNSPGIRSLVLYQLNSGPMREKVLYDFMPTSVQNELFFPDIKVNNNGTVLVAINLGGGRTEALLVDKDGVSKSLLSVNRKIPHQGNAIAINDYNTAFITLISETNPNIFEIYSLIVASNGQVAMTKVGESYYGALNGSLNFKATNYQTANNPEGVLYYLKSIYEIVGTDGSTILNLSSTPHKLLDFFSINDNREYVYIENDTSLGRLTLFKGDKKIIQIGDVLDGLPVSGIAHPNINNTGNISFTVSNHIPMAPAQLAVYRGSAAEKLCKVEDSRGGKLVSFFPQGDGEWISDLVGNVPTKTMKNKGCAVASLAMLMNYYDLKSLNGSLITPKNLNIDMYSHKGGIGFSKKSPADASWAKVAEIMRDAYVNQCPTTKPPQLCKNESKSLVSYKEEAVLNSFLPVDEKKIEDEICKGNPVIVALKNKRGTHFVLATGYVRDSGRKILRFHDPGNSDLGRNRVYDSNMKAEYPEIIGFRRYVQAADPAMIFGNSSSNISFIVTDPSNKKAGYNSITEISYNEIPNALYYKEGIDSPAGIDDPNFEESVRFTHMHSVLNGTYNIQVIGAESGPYRLEFNSHDVDGFSNDNHFFEGIISKGEVINLSFNHIDTPLPITNSNLNIYYALYLDPKWSKRPENDRLIISGKLGSTLVLDEDVKVQIGGINGINIDINKEKFRSYTLKKVTYYKTINSQNEVMIISSSGEFWLSLKEVNLAELAKNKWSHFYFQIGNKNGETKINLNCKKNLCIKGN